MVTGVYVYCYWSDKKRKVIFRLEKPVCIDGFLVSSGFETDFASIPRWARWLIPTIGKHNIAALLHDWMYEKQVGNRKFADDQFLKIMLTYTVPKWKKIFLIAQLPGKDVK